MGRTTSAGNDHTKALLPGLLGKVTISSGVRWAESTAPPQHPQILQGLHRRVHGGKVGIAAHDHRHPGLMRWRGWGMRSRL